MVLWLLVLCERGLSHCQEVLAGPWLLLQLWDLWPGLGSECDACLAANGQEHVWQCAPATCILCVWPCYSMLQHATKDTLQDTLPDTSPVSHRIVGNSHNIIYTHPLFHGRTPPGDDPATTYNEQTDSCDPLRRLSARRRSGSFSSSRRSWSSGGSRRLSPYAASTSARRRSWSAPSTVSQRRRAPPPPAVRRRAPPPPVPSPTEGRRRSSSLSGQTFSTTPRRLATSNLVNLGHFVLGLNPAVIVVVWYGYGMDQIWWI